MTFRSSAGQPNHGDMRHLSRAVAIGSLIALIAWSASAEQLRTVERIRDGDTIVLEGGEVVRLIGVDTPETVHPRKPVEHFGKEASEFTRSLTVGKRVSLESDPQTAPKDRFGRTLAYVRLPDGRMLNLEIVRQGYGHAYVEHPFSRMEEFRAAEREAREAERGLWAPTGAASRSEQDR